MKKIIWISSYPKSGNTWMRSLIANYFYNRNQKINSLDILKNIRKFPNTKMLESLIPREEIIKNPFIVSKYWLELQKLLTDRNDEFIFLKNHNALISINDTEFTNENFTLGSIFVVRDPRDIAISYSNFDKTLSINNAVNRLISYGSKDLLSVVTRDNVYDIEILGSWKFNYISWRDGVKNMPRIIIKYEDLLKNTYETFLKVLDFLSNILNCEINYNQAKFAVKQSKFSNLKKLETKGFDEYKENVNFFNNGKSGLWKNFLTDKQIEVISQEFSKEMKELNYL